jgi:long-chain acyl-CoA synthetase
MLQTLFEQPGGRTFLQVQHKAYSYQWLQQKIKQISGLFASLGIGAGQRLLLAVSDESEMAALFLAALANGVTVVITDPDTKAPRAKSIIERSSPAAIIADRKTLECWQPDPAGIIAIFSYEKEMGPRAGLLGKFLQKNKTTALNNDYRAALENCPPVNELPALPDPDLIAYIIFTSGTTAGSKGVAITHGNLRAHLSTLKKVYGLDEKSMLLNTLLLWHADGCIQGPLLAACAGCTWHNPFSFSIERIPALLDYCYANDITHFFAVPAILNMILQFSENYEDSFRYPAFKALISVSAHLEAPLWDKFETVFQVSVSNVYGLTETVAGSLFSGPLADTRRKHTVGRPVDCEIRILNDLEEPVGTGETGELCLRGAHVMKSYWSDPTLTAEAVREGWFFTGDLASQDKEGFVTIRGRKKNLIISGGTNIQPEEVTECMLAHPAISEACALGLPDEVFGEKLVAAVVLKTGFTTTGVELIEYCRQLLEEKKVPQRIHLVAGLPKGVSGKVQLNLLKEQLSKPAEGLPANRGQFADDVLSIAAESFQVPVSRLSVRDTSQTLTGWDSLAHLTFVTSLEDHFKIRFNTAEVMTMNSIQRATDLIKEKYA